MKQTIGVLLMIIGILIMLFGGLVYFVVQAFDFMKELMNGTAGFWDLLWLFFSWFIRPIIAFVVGGVVLIFGRALLGD